MLPDNRFYLQIERSGRWLQYEGTVSTEFLEELAEQAGTIWPHYANQ
jgi:hypothetical protein